MMVQLRLPFMDTVEVKLSPYEEHMVNKLRSLNRTYGPVRSPAVAMTLGLPERSARYYLNQLESYGRVARPRGPRSGWVVCV